MEKNEKKQEKTEIRKFGGAHVAQSRPLNVNQTLLRHTSALGVLVVSEAR